jgi:hypothetical protein
VRPALPLLALLLAGCVATPPAPSAPPPGAAAALAFEVQKLPGDFLGAEPNMVAGPDGDVWVIAVGSVLADPAQNINEGKVNLWHSADQGATWERQRDPGPQDKNGTWCSCDTDVDLGPDGTVYLTDFWVGNPVDHTLGQLPDAPVPLPVGAPGQNGFTTEASTDGGATWAPGNFVTVTRAFANDRQYITAGRDPGEVYLSYARAGFGLPVPIDAPDAGLHLLRSTDFGRTYAQMSQPFQSTATSDAFIARLRVGEDGTVYYPWVASLGFNETATMVVAVSRDRGQTFERFVAGEAPDGVGGLWPMQMDVGPDGLLHMAWMARDPAGGSRLLYARSADQGATWTPARVVGWSNGTALLPWIAHAGPGRAVIAYYGNPAPMYALDAPNATQWHAWAIVIGNSAAEDLGPVQVAPWPVKVGTFCPYGAACPEDRELLDYPAVTWRDGWVHVTFAASLLDEGAGPASEGGAAPRGGHATNAYVYAARARLP